MEMSGKVRIQPLLPLKKSIREAANSNPTPFREPLSLRPTERSSENHQKARKRSLPKSDVPDGDQRRSKRARKEKKSKKERKDKKKKKKKKKKHHHKKSSKSGKREKCEEERHASAAASASEVKPGFAKSEQPAVAPPPKPPGPKNAECPAEPKMKDEECYAESDTDSELNLDRPLLRIQDYFDDKREMCHQMFQTLQGRKLRSMIPEVLRDCSLIEVRNMCHKELEGMSKKRVIRILKGDDPKTISSSSSSGGNTSGRSSRSSSSSSRESSPSSSSSSTSSSSSNSPNRPRHRQSRKHRQREKKSSEPVVDSTCKLESPREEEKKEASPAAALEEPPVEQDLLVVSAADLDDDLDFSPSPPPVAAPAVLSVAASPTKSPAKPLSRTQLEIAELEMRARAIRAMLNAQEKKDPRIRLLRK